MAEWREGYLDDLLTAFQHRRGLMIEDRLARVIDTHSEPKKLISRLQAEARRQDQVEPVSIQDARRQDAETIAAFSGKTLVKAGKWAEEESRG